MCTGGCLQVQLGKPLLISWAQKAACLAPWPLLVLNCMRNQVAWQSGRLCSGCQCCWVICQVQPIDSCLSAGWQCWLQALHGELGTGHVVLLASRCNRHLILIPALQSLADALADIAAECTQQQAAAAGGALEGAEGMTFASAPPPSTAGRPLRSSGSTGRGTLKAGSMRTGGGSRHSSCASRDSSQAASKRSSLDPREALQVG